MSKHPKLIQIAALILVSVAVSAWAFDILSRNDIVGLIAPLGFACIVMAIWKPWRTI